MTVEKIHDPLASYLDDMFSPDEAGTEQHATGGSSDVRASSVEGSDTESAQPAPLQQADVAWWGFGVAHLILALPGEAVSGVLEKVPGDQLADSGKLYQGYLDLDGASCLLVDAARLILPEAHFQKLPPLAERAAGAVVLRDTGIALICDSPARGVEIENGEVRWRQGSGSRRWMAGTIMDRNMVVLDVGGVMESVSMGENA